MFKTQASEKPNLVLGIVLAGLVFSADTLIPHGMAIPIAYVVVVALMQATGSRRWIWGSAAACSTLTLLGLAWPAASEDLLHEMLANRGLIIIALWVIAGLSVRNVSLEHYRRESQLRQRIALEAGVTGTWYWDIPSGRIQVDENLARMYSLDPELATGEGLHLEAFLPAIHPDYQAELQQRLQDTLDHGKEFAFDYPILTPEGTERWVSATGHVIHDRSGRARSFPGVVLDVTKRKVAEADALRLSAEAILVNARFRALFEQSEIFAVLLDEDGTVTAANRFSLDSCGYVADETIGTSFWDAGWWHGSPETQRQIRRATEGAAAGSSYRGEHPYWLADGSERIVDLALHPIRDGGRTQFVYASGTDVTEHKSAEDNLRRYAETFTRLVDRSPFGIYVVDSRFCLSRVSEGAQPAFRNVRPLLGRDFGEAIHIIWPKPIADDVVLRFRHTLETGEPYLAPSLIAHRSDVDVTESYEWQLHRVTLPDGTFGVVCYYFDSTELRETELALRESERKAQRANRAKTEFLANMSHEIRTPMSAILGHVDLLLTRLEDPESRSSVSTIKRNGRHLLDIINDILDLSRIEAGKLTTQSSVCDVARLLADVDSLMRVRIEDKPVEFRVEARGPVPESIHTDETRLRQVLVNLVGNAIKFTERGHVLLTAEFLENEEQPRLRFAVEDTGIGIAAEQLPTLFRPFVQGDASITRNFGGSGLGLAICKRLTEALGGDLAVESSPGRGSTFSVTVPIGSPDRVRLVEVSIDSPPSDEVEPQPTTRLSCHLLLADDNPDVRTATQLFLERAGATVEVANNGAVAVRKVGEAEAREEPFDALIMDMQMPELDGYSAVSKIRSAGHEMPILALTAAAMPEDRQLCLDAGCDEYLSKPTERRSLLAMIRLLTARQKEAESPSVLVVDDSPDVAQATAMLLRLKGFTVAVAHDGAGAIRTVAELSPKIVLLDIGLPDTDGYRVAETLRAGGFHGLLIALSGRDSQEDMENSRAAGFDDHLVKPADPEALVRLMREPRR